LYEELIISDFASKGGEATNIVIIHS